MATAEPTEVMESRFSERTCDMCLKRIKDPRLLNCLHSFCRGCVDMQVLTNFSVDETSHKGGRFVCCPLCRSVCPLPDVGAIGLVADGTIPAEEEKLTCSTCNEDGHEGQSPFFWCTQCCVVFCQDHVVSHMVTFAKDGHSVAAIPRAARKIQYWHFRPL